ncbi:hypothetical protein K439DRAFT_1330202 [Ramaria rubella]|nr:hypothetical protein K439DRAFT_1330202 [Ramaria rubella]
MQFKSVSNAISVPMPKVQNFIYLNKEYHNEMIGKLFVKTKGLSKLFETHVAVCTGCEYHSHHFIKAALNGEFENKAIFMGMVEVMTIQNECEQRGVGMQNYKYPHIYDEFCHITAITSPMAYHQFTQHFQGCTVCSFQ